MPDRQRDIGIMREYSRVVVFRLAGRRYALPLVAVERIVRAVEVVPLPGAPLVVLGLIDMGGRVLPVINLRRRFGLHEREIEVSDQFLIAQTARRPVVLVIDEVEGVVECDPSAIVPSEPIAPGLQLFEGVAILKDGLVLIHDLTRLLSLDEMHALEEAMREEADAHHQ
jgi:purine-binding chemotaxis protein CheW